MMFTLNSQVAFVHLDSDSGRMNPAADAIIHRDFPLLRLVTTRSPRALTNLEQTCQSKEIGYHRYTEQLSFEDWLVGKLLSTTKLDAAAADDADDDDC